MATEVLIDQTTKLGQTNWAGGSAWQGQLFLPPPGEIWRLTEISGYGDGNTWQAKQGNVAIGICNSKTDWNPNNGYKLIEINYFGCTSNSPKHTFDLTHSSGGLPNGLLVNSDHMYWFYFRLNASSAGAQCHSSAGYAPDGASITVEAIDSSNAGGTWNRPATWLSAPNDLRFELVGEKIGTGGGATSILGPWII